MIPTPRPRLLSDDEIARLDALLEETHPQESMTVEELDGFLTALVACPEPVPADEWVPLALGVPATELTTRLGEGRARELTRLLERHRSALASQLHEREALSPILAVDEAGRAIGTGWAVGYVRGLGMRPETWDALEEDPEYADAFDAAMRLVEEVEAPEGAAGEPIPDADRQGLVDAMIESAIDVFEFFRDQRARGLGPSEPRRRDAPKVGRNDPCPCGSGRNFKQCCGAPSAGTPPA